MKCISTLIITLLILTGCASNKMPTDIDTHTLNLMSFNIRYGTAPDKDNHWDKRRDLVLETIRRANPDVLGVQEALDFQVEVLEAALPGYKRLGEGRDGGPTKSDGEHAAIYYRTDRLKVISSETLWLSDTPHVPSITWNHRHRRIVTIAKFRLVESGKEFMVYNTHYQNQVHEARIRSTGFILNHIAAREEQTPLALMGDFNSNPTSTSTKPITDSGLIDSFGHLHPGAKDTGTGNRFIGRTSSSRIDYIFTSPDITVKEAAIDHYNKEGRYPSDHFPVTAVVTLP